MAESEAAADPVEAARAVVLRSLSTAPRTRSQLAESLASRGVPEDVATATLDRFEELGLIDDADFAQMWVRSRHQRKGLSRRALRHELGKKGVPKEDIDSALADVDEDSEYRAALGFAQRKVRSMSALETEARRRRLMGALARRGYSSGLSARVAREVLADQAEDVDVADDYLVE